MGGDILFLALFEFLCFNVKSDTHPSSFMEGPEPPPVGRVIGVAPSGSFLVLFLPPRQFWGVSSGHLNQLPVPGPMQALSLHFSNVDLKNGKYENMCFQEPRRIREP